MKSTPLSRLAQTPAVFRFPQILLQGISHMHYKVSTIDLLEPYSTSPEVHGMQVRKGGLFLDNSRQQKGLVSWMGDCTLEQLINWPGLVLWVPQLQPGVTMADKWNWARDSDLVSYSRPWKTATFIHFWDRKGERNLVCRKQSCEQSLCYVVS